jgi:hypothetical protein
LIAASRPDPWRARASSALDSLLRTTGPNPKEVLGMGLVLVAVAALTYGPHVAGGGFYLDDWSIARDYRFADSPRYWTTVGILEDVLGGRPLGALALPLPHALFGMQQELHLAFAVGIGIATSLCLFLLLRTLTLAPLHAGAIAVLSLLFPWSDTLRLWPGVSVFGFSVCFLLIGLVLALNGLKRRGRAAIALHAGAAGLYVLSVLTYEATGAVALLAGLLYLGRAPVRAVARRWLADAAVVLAALGYSLATTVQERQVGSIGERIEDVGRFVHESLLLLVSALIPLEAPGRALTGLVLLTVATIVAFALARCRRPDQPDLRRWLWLIAIGLGAIGATYSMFLGSNLHPKDPGIHMRINIVAGLGFSIFAYATVAAASSLVFRSRGSAAVAALAVTLVIAGGYWAQVRDDAAQWQRASELQEEVLRAVDRELPPLPRESALLTFGFPAQAGPEVPIFDKSWDLEGAVDIQTGDPTLRAFPVYEGIVVRCGREGLVISGAGSYGSSRFGYGSIFFLDVGGGEASRISSRGACREALRTFRPGPLRA